MKTLNITLHTDTDLICLEGINPVNPETGRLVPFIEAKSDSAMWKVLRAVRDRLTDKDLALGFHADVYDPANCGPHGGDLYKKIVFRRNSKGKIEMPNRLDWRPCNHRRDRIKAEKAAKVAKAAASEIVTLDYDEAWPPITV